MNKLKIIFVFALIVTLMPFTGFTRSIKTATYVFSGIVIMLLSSPTKISQRINLNILKSKKSTKFFEESRENNSKIDGSHIA